MDRADRRPPESVAAVSRRAGHLLARRREGVCLADPADGSRLLGAPARQPGCLRDRADRSTERRGSALWWRATRVAAQASYGNVEAALAPGTWRNNESAIQKTADNERIIYLEFGAS